MLLLLGVSCSCADNERSTRKALEAYTDEGDERSTRKALEACADEGDAGHGEDLSLLQTAPASLHDVAHGSDRMSPALRAGSASTQVGADMDGVRAGGGLRIAHHRAWRTRDDEGLSHTLLCILPAISFSLVLVAIVGTVLLEQNRPGAAPHGLEKLGGRGIFQPQRRLRVHTHGQPPIKPWQPSSRNLALPQPPLQPPGAAYFPKNHTAEVLDSGTLDLSCEEDELVGTGEAEEEDCGGDGVGAARQDD